VDYVELPKYSVAGTEMVQHNFPKGTCNCGGPTGIATETDIIGTMGKPAQTLQRANGEEALYFSKLPYGRQMSSPPPVPMAG
jgi:hypothetical protein